MNVEEFKKIIVYEELALLNDTQKFILKATLKMPVGKRSFQSCRLVCVGRVINYGKMNFKTRTEAVDLERAFATNQLCGLFDNLLREGYWTIKDSVIYYFDENGRELEKLQGAARSKCTETIDTYYLNKKRIKEISAIEEA